MTSEEQGTGWLYGGGTDVAEITERYDEWAESYDHDIHAWSYDAPEVVAGIVASHLSSSAAVLDAGCGTGLVGRALRAAGMLGPIDGIDVSEASLRIADESGAYDKVAVGDLQQPLAASDDSYDALVCVGVMTYVPDVEGAWREFARVVRSGGLVVVTQREDLWEPRECRSVIDRLADEGIWSVVAVDGPAPYLPGNTEGMGDVGVCYVTCRVG